jgi:hypothetical protein
MELLVFLLFVGVVYLLVKVSGLSAKIRMLESRMAGMSALMHHEQETAPAPHVETPVVQTAPPPGVRPQPAPEPQPFAAEPSPAREPILHPPPPPPATPKKQRTSQEWEWLIGGKLLNRIAAVALVLGVSFFLKYAIDRNWISEWMQIGIGIGAGAALLVGAAQMHKRGFQIFAQGLVGAGIAILYLSVYASFNFYSLVSQPVAFLMMGAVTVVTFYQAFRYDSLVVSILGWAGGFATPFLLSTGEANAAGLFTYLTLLDVGILAVIVVRRQWFALLPLAFAATYLIFILWLDSTGGRDNEITGAISVTAFWLLFHALDVYRSRREEPSTWTFERIIACFNAVLFSLSFYQLLDGTYHGWMGGLTLIGAAVYAASAFILSRNSERARGAIVQYGVAALVLLICATELQFGSFTAIYCYAAEIILIAFLSRRKNGEMLWAGAVALLVWATFALLFTDNALFMNEVEGYRPVLNQRFLAFMFLIGAAFAGIYRAPGTDRSWTPLARGILHAVWVALLALLLPLEINDAMRHAGDAAETLMRRHLQYLTGPAIGIAWALYGALLVHFARARRNPVIFAGAAIVGLLATLVTASWNLGGYLPIEWFTTIINWHFAASLLTVVCLAWMARTYDGIEGAFGKIAQVFTAGWILVGFAAITAEVVDTFGKMIRTASEDGGDSFERLMILAALWTIYGVVVFWIGSRQIRSVPLIAGLVLVCAGWLTAVLRGIAFEPITVFNPIVNMRVGTMVAIGAGLVGMRIIADRATDLRPWLTPIPPVLRILTALLLLTLVTGEIRDYFEKAIAYQNPELATTELENIKQLMLSAAWLGFSITLMAYGIMGRERILRVLAIVLFGLAILKIFIYDLSFLETLYRIFSFIGLGLILLAVSYLYQKYRDVILGNENTEAKEAAVQSEKEV